MLIGGLLLGEPVGPVKLSGLILVVTGIALVAWAGPARRIRIRPKLQSGRAAA
jgi:drug/metabolite transporter (DMT)-like permease